MKPYLEPVQDHQVVGDKIVFINRCPVCLQALKVETACKYCGWCKDAKRK